MGSPGCSGPLEIFGGDPGRSPQFADVPESA